MSDLKDVGFIPLTIRRSRSFRLKFQYKPGGVAADLTGYSAKMMVKTKPSDPAPWPGFDLSTANGRIVISANGTVEVTVPASVTAALPVLPVQGVFDVILVSPGGVVKPVLEGPVMLVDSVTTL